MSMPSPRGSSSCGVPGTDGPRRPPHCRAVRTLSWQRLGVAGAQRVDVQPATAGVARVHRQLDRAAARPQVHEDALHALFVELVVVAEADQVPQQAGLVDLGSAVLDAHAAPVRLPGHQAVALEQVAGERFRDGGLAMVRMQQLRGGGVVRALHVQAVQQQAVELLHGFAVEHLGQHQFHAHGRLAVRTAPRGLADVRPDARLHLCGIRESRVVEAVQVELERLALDDVGGLAGNGDVREGDLRLAAQVQPRQLEGGPQVRPEKGAGCPSRRFRGAWAGGAGGNSSEASYWSA